MEPSLCSVIESTSARMLFKGCSLFCTPYRFCNKSGPFAPQDSGVTGRNPQVVQVPLLPAALRATIRRDNLRLAEPSRSYGRPARGSGGGGAEKSCTVRRNRSRASSRSIVLPDTPRRYVPNRGLGRTRSQGASSGSGCREIGEVSGAKVESLSVDGHAPRERRAGADLAHGRDRPSNQRLPRGRKFTGDQQHRTENPGREVRRCGSGGKGFRCRTAPVARDGPANPGVAATPGYHFDWSQWARGCRLR